MTGSIFLPNGALLMASVLVPLFAAAASLVPHARRAVPVLVVLAPVPALLAALLVSRGESVVMLPAPFRLSLAIDGPGSLLLGGASLLWLAAGQFATAYLRSDPSRRSFFCWWFLTMAGSFAVFLVADLASFYLAYALVSFAAFGLVVHDDTQQARQAGNVYLSLTVLGEAFLIAAFVMLAVGSDGANPLISEAVSTLSASPWQGPILALLLLGFTMKMGLVPLHVWMPLAHSVAPAPGSAVLSGIVVKAGVIGLIRFLPIGVPMPGWGETLTAAGLFTAMYGVAVGVTQRHPKRALAYSTVSQMGVVAVVLGAGLSSGDETALELAAFYAMNHMLLKGAMFLTVGAATTGGPSRLRLGMIVLGVLGLSLAGLPLTGGALTKVAIKSIPMGGITEFLLIVSAAGTTMLMAHAVLLLSRVKVSSEGEPGLLLPWLTLAGVAVILPFAFYSAVTGQALDGLQAPMTLFKGTLPVVLGLVAASVLRAFSRTVPEIPAGDIISWYWRASPAIGGLAVLSTRIDAFLRQWIVATLTLVLLTVVVVIALAS